MKAAELAIIASYDIVFRTKVRQINAWAKQMFADRPYRLSLMTYSRPEVSGNRTAIQQNAFFKSGKSKRDGYKKISQHQRKKATHYGFRSLDDENYCPDYEDMPADMKADFHLLVEKCRSMGLRWGGEFKDWHHFEEPEEKKPMAPEGPAIGDDRMYFG